MLANIVLGLLCVFVAVLAVTLLQHLFLTVPFIPTPQAVVHAMVDAAALQGHETVYDLGAGDARLLITAKRRYPGIRARGCELVWLVWVLGKLRIAFAGQAVTLTRESVYAMDVADADVVFLYLFPSMMGKLAERFDRRLRPGTVVLSHAFRFPGRTEERVVLVGAKKLYIYRW